MVFTRLHAQFEIPGCITQSDVCCRCNIQSWYSDEVPVNISRWNISAVTKRDDPKFAWSLLVVPCEYCCRTACVDSDDRAGRLVSRPRPGLKLSQQIKEGKFDCNNTKSVSMSHQGFIGIKSGACSCFLVDRTETPTLSRLVLQPWSGPCMPSPRGTQKALFVPSFVVANKTQKIPAVGTSVCHLFSRVLLSVLSSVQMS